MSPPNPYLCRLEVALCSLKASNESCHDWPVWLVPETVCWPMLEVAKSESIIRNCSHPTMARTIFIGCKVMASKNFQVLSPNQLSKAKNLKADQCRTMFWARCVPQSL